MNLLTAQLCHTKHGGCIITVIQQSKCKPKFPENPVKILYAAPTECASQVRNNALLDALKCALPHWHSSVHWVVQSIYRLIVVYLAGRIDRCLEDRLKAYAGKVESQNAFTYHIPPIKDQEEKYFLPYIGKWLMWVTNILLIQVL